MVDRIHRQETLPVTGPAIAAEFLDGMGEMPPHGHDYVEIVLVVGGGAAHVSQGSERRVARGYCAVIRPGEWHAWDACDNLQLWNVYVGPEVLWRELRWFRDTTLGSRLVGPPRPGWQIERELDDDAIARAQQWLAMVPPRASDGLATHAGRVAALCGALGEMAAGHGREDRELSASSGQLAPIVARTLQLLEHDLSHRWTVGELADHLHLSASHLSRVFSQSTGMAPMTYLARLRAEHVAADLINDDTPVSEIGRRHGWPDPNYASRRFRHFFGTSPRAFRQQFGSGPAAPAEPSASMPTVSVRRHGS